MIISDFVRLVQSEYNAQRGNTRYIDIIDLPSPLFKELANEIGVIGSGSFHCFGIQISEDVTQLQPDYVKVHYQVLQGDYQGFYFKSFRHLSYGNCKLAICSPPSFGSPQLSGINQYPGSYTLSSNGTSIKPWVDDMFGYTGLSEPVPTGCQHTWKHYQGFHLEQYDYCSKCDEKKK